MSEYSLSRQGSINISGDFKVKEFACKDGSDKVLVDDGLVELLQMIRDHFQKPVFISSAYRTERHNRAVGGSPRSQHLLGKAADIVVSGVLPLEVAQYAEFLLDGYGGVGLYNNFTHVDVRTSRSRWDNTSGKEVPVTGFPGYQSEAWYEAARKWAIEKGITDGERPGDTCTRAEVWEMLYRLNKKG